MTSDRGLDLILNQVLAEVLSFGIGTIAHKVGSFFSSRLALFGGRAQRLAAEIGNKLERVRGTSGWRHLIGDVNSRNMPLLVRFSDALMGMVEAPSLRAAERLALSGLWWFAGRGGIISQMIMQVAFEAATRIDGDQQPLGGSQAFFMVMTMSILTHGVLGALRSFSSDGQVLSRLPKVSHQDYWSVIRKVQYVAIGLSLVQVFMRYPVLMANRA